MQSLFLIYLADIADQIKVTLVVLLSISGLLYFFTYAAVCNDKALCHIELKVRKSLKPFLCIWITLFLIRMFMPSNTFLYTLAGVSISKEILKSEKTDVLLNKSYKVLNKKLDEYLKKE